MCVVDLDVEDVKLDAIFPIDVALHIVVITGCCVMCIYIAPNPYSSKWVDALGIASFFGTSLCVPQ